MQHTDEEERYVQEDLALLRARAERYAHRGQKSATAEMRVLAFVRGRSTYAVVLEKLREVRPWPKLCFIPGASPIVPGVFQYRGALLSAHDPAKFMGLDSSTAPQWMLVIEHQDERLGLIADDVLGIRAIPHQAVQSVPVTFGARSACFLGAVEPDLLLLDADKLFAIESFFSAF